MVINKMAVFPKISIITPSYNQGEYIEQTISSVLDQNYPNVEYIIIDGGSTDQSVEIIKKYEKHLTYWESKPDKGQTHAINKGLQRSTGEVLNWLNSDDYYEPNALYRVGKLFSSQESEVLVAAGKSKKFRESGTTAYISKGVDIYPESLAKTIGWARMDQPETFFHRKVIDRIGLLNENLHYLMDRDWWIRYLLAFGMTGIVQSDDILVNFRLHPESKSISQAERFHVEHDSFYYSLANIYGLSEYLEIIEQNFTIDKKIELNIKKETKTSFIKEILNYHILNRAHEAYYQNNKLLAEKLLKCIRPELLNNNDIMLWQKIKFRNRFLPSFLLNLFRKRTALISRLTVLLPIIQYICI